MRIARRHDARDAIPDLLCLPYERQLSAQIYSRDGSQRHSGMRKGTREQAGPDTRCDQFERDNIISRSEDNARSHTKPIENARGARCILAMSANDQRLLVKDLGRQPARQSPRCGNRKGQHLPIIQHDPMRQSLKSRRHPGQSCIYPSRE